MDEPHVPALVKFKTSDGDIRTFRISIPGDYTDDSSTKWPLIIDFHGHGGDALGQWDNSQYYLKSSGQEYFIVYPNGCEGTPGKRGPEKAWYGAPYANPNCDDEQFVSDLLDYFTKTGPYNIDSKRVYASGKSNGGGFVGTLACSSVGDRFTAFAMASAALYTDNPGDSCTYNQSRPILESHGTADTIIPFGGETKEIDGTVGTVPDIIHWAHRWAVRDGCDDSARPNFTRPSPDWGVHRSYSCKSSSNIVQQLAVKDLHHCWPSVTENTDILKASKDNPCETSTLDFTQVVLDFFAMWPKSQ